GSGTILYEAQCLGMSAIGVDNNPIAYDLSKAKIEQKSWEYYEQELNTLVSDSKLALESGNVPKMPEEALKHFHDESASEIMSVSEKIDNASDYIKGCYYGAIALIASDCKNCKQTHSTD